MLCFVDTQIHLKVIVILEIHYSIYKLLFFFPSFFLVNKKSWASIKIAGYPRIFWEVQWFYQQRSTVCYWLYIYRGYNSCWGYMAPRYDDKYTSPTPFPPFSLLDNSLLVSILKSPWQLEWYNRMEGQAFSF